MDLNSASVDGACLAVSPVLRGLFRAQRETNPLENKTHGAGNLCFLVDETEQTNRDKEPVRSRETNLKNEEKRERRPQQEVKGDSSLRHWGKNVMKVSDEQ